MRSIGLDIGTKTIVVSYKDSKNKINYLSEINGYWIFEIATPFIENMLNDPNKIRQDGTKRPARWIKIGNKILVLGRDAEEFAYAKNDTLLRPMAEGGVGYEEDGMMALSAIIQGLLNMAENDIGKTEEELKVCYCTTANAINKDLNISYHERVVDMILDKYESKTKLSKSRIKESHAIVLDMSQDGTGIGISWGAGTVTVSFVMQGLEQYSFSVVGAGDWIDEQVAMRYGYDKDLYKTRKKKAQETPTTVCRRKLDIDLTPGTMPSDRVGVDIVLHYDVLISDVINNIINGFIENQSQARIDDNVSIYMAGGTSSPKGFTERVKAKFDSLEDKPFTIKEIIKSQKPLYSVASGCYKASEFGL